METMTSKELELMLDLILELLKQGQVEKVIELLEKAKTSSPE